MTTTKPTYETLEKELERANKAAEWNRQLLNRIYATATEKCWRTSTGTEGRIDQIFRCIAWLDDDHRARIDTLLATGKSYQKTLDDIFTIAYRASS